MRLLAALSVLSVLVLGSAPDALALSKKSSRLHRGHVPAVQSSFQRATSLVAKAAASGLPAARPAGAAAPSSLLSALEVDIVGRINAQRGARGLRALRVSRGLTAAADYHSRQMGLFGFFEHESRNGAPFWRRIERFYPSGRRYWSVGENILWESPEHERLERRARMDAEPASSPEHPHARVARSRRRRRAFPRSSGRIRRPRGHDRDRRFRRQTLGSRFPDRRRLRRRLAPLSPLLRAARATSTVPLAYGV